MALIGGKMRTPFLVQFTPWLMSTFLFLGPTFAETDSGAFLSLSKNQDLEVVFNTPGFQDKPGTSIEKKIIELIQSAVPGSSIHISIYIFRHQKIAQELVAASDRGVNVEIILDGKSKKHLKSPGHAVHILTTSRNGQPALRCQADPCVTFCDSLAGSSCRGLHINHNKFLLFSHLKDGTQNVVAQTSYNLNLNQNLQYNDMVIIKNDPRLYENYLRYWRSLKKDKVKMTRVKSLHGKNGIKAYLFPRLTGADPVLRILNTVSCEPTGSQIRVVQSRFDRFRVDIAKRLAALRDQGCDIKVIVRSETKLISPTKKLRPLLGKDLYILPFQTSKGITIQKNSVHSKLILIDASLKGSKEKKSLVLTGSHNLDLPSLRTNDEVLLSIPDRDLYEKYLRFWERILSDAQRASVLPSQPEA